MNNKYLTADHLAKIEAIKEQYAELIQELRDQGVLVADKDDKGIFITNEYSSDVHHEIVLTVRSCYTGFRIELGWDGSWPTV